MNARPVLGMAVGMAFAAASMGRAQAPSVFRAEVEEVYVDVFVTPPAM